MESLFLSTGLITIAEIGDKTQLLAFMLAVRFRKNFPIILGITLATILNHALAGLVGQWLYSMFNEELLKIILVIVFVSMAIWILIPDKLDENINTPISKWGVFCTTFIAFFIAEMGDKTQIATLALSTNYSGQTLLVILGTTIGMLIANVPAVFFGDKLAEKIPLNLMRYIAAAFFFIFALLIMYSIN